MSKTRSRYLIDYKVQGALARRIVLHWGIFMVLASVSLVAIQYFTGDPNLSLLEHFQVVCRQYAFFFVLMCAILPAFVYDSMKLSNRFAGPVLRLKANLKKLANGEEVEELQFRGTDFWRELSNDFNRVADRVGTPKA